MRIRLILTTGFVSLLGVLFVLVPRTNKDDQFKKHQSTAPTESTSIPTHDLQAFAAPMNQVVSASEPDDDSQLDNSVATTITKQAEMDSDIRFASYLYSLDGYSDDQIALVRSTLSEAEIERQLLPYTLDFASPTIGQEISEGLLRIEETNKERLSTILSKGDMENYDSYLASIHFRETLPNIRSQLQARRIPISENTAEDIARAYQRAVAVQREQASQKSDPQTSSTSEPVTFDERFLKEAAAILDDKSFDAFTSIYLDQQFR